MTGGPAPVPEGSVLLHIGPQKTGSTAIQQALFDARAALADHGVHYVGRRPVEKEAGWVALGLVSSIGRRPPRPQAWQRLVDEIAGVRLPRTCLSNEEFGRADEAAVERILAATGAERTHLVYVARRLDKVLPSHWQQQTRARLTASYPDFLREVLDPVARSWTISVVMAPQDVGAVLARWGTWLPPERMTVVVADEDDDRALPQAFESLLGLPAGLIEPPHRPANRSMGFVETEALRRINRLVFEEEWSHAEYRHVVQAGIVPALRERPDGDGPRIGGVPAWAFDRVAELADAQVDAIGSSGVNVVGDPERLRVRGRVEPVELPAEVTEVSLDLLADVVSGTRAGAARLERRPPADLRDLHGDAGGRELLQLLARRAAGRLGVRRR